MKPVSLIQNSQQDANRRFPVIDRNYHALELGEFKSRCAGTLPSSFAQISCNYFNVEARRHFLIEGVLFAMIAVTAMPAIWDCGRAIIQLLRAVGGM